MKKRRESRRKRRDKQRRREKEEEEDGKWGIERRPSRVRKLLERYSKIPWLICMYVCAVYHHKQIF